METKARIEDIFASAQKLDESFQAKAQNIKKEHFNLYTSLISELRKDSTLALLYNVWTIIRRIVLLYVAMFLASQAWV